jgi:hypothetical protein
MKSYVIVRTDSDKNSMFHALGTPEFVFTSLKKAMQQMQILERMVLNGTIFVRLHDEPINYKLGFTGCDEYWDKDKHPYRIVVEFTDRPESIVVYDLWVVETNSSYTPKHLL